MINCSIALCTYNGARFVRGQLQSIFAQTALPDEIVLFDDVSSDDTLAIAESMRGQAEALGIEFVIRQNRVNLGYVKNFELCSAACRGAIIFLSDQDDIWVPHKIETLLAIFRNDPALLLAYSDAHLVDAVCQPMGCKQSEALGVSSEEFRLVATGRGFDALLVRNLVTGATAAFRRELLQVAAPFSKIWVHDEWLAVIAAAKGAIAFCPEPLIDYRQHDANTLGLRRRKLSERLRAMLRSRGDYYKLQVARAEDLHRRLATLRDEIGQDKMIYLEERLAHVRYRATLPSSRLARLGPALREWQSGRYQRYSSGLRAVARDLLEGV